MNAPTLIVGLGGAGSKIVRRVSELVTPEQKDSIEFVVFDTDVNEQRDIRKNCPDIRVIQTSTKLTVGEYLEIDHHARDTWFPVNKILNNKVISEGAGQVRAISRLAFDTAVRADKMEPLHEAIQDLFKLETIQNIQALRVIIVSSLAGGTGSGLIIPVGMYIKNYLSMHFRQSGNITRGFFILPEVFDEVIPGRAERNNLRANAYATLRELDAFLMKGDDTLPKQFCDSVSIETPKPGSEEYDEYHLRPYDFCFLFDAQNSEGCKLNSFDQYLSHAANCIYAQSIGPMNKRSNSSEDNVIRRLCAEHGRNRYAGAGSSMMVYPLEDIKEYIALHWAQHNVSDQWMVYDNIYKQKCQEADRARAAGANAVNPDPALDYTTTVEQMAKNGDAFSKAIVNACSRMDPDGVTKLADSWDIYIDALVKKIREDESRDQGRLDEQRGRANSAISEISAESKSWEPFVDAWVEMDKYRAMVYKRRDDMGHTIAATLFKAPNENITKDQFAHQLETYLRDADGSFIHPNAIRYFLYKALEQMRAQKALIDKENRQAEDILDNFAKNHFDDKTTEEEETVESLASRKVGLMDKLRNRLSDDQEEMKRQYVDFMAKADKYRGNSILSLVLKEGIDYIIGISEAFRRFFGSFDSKVDSLSKGIGYIEKKYQPIRGSTTRYVCTSEKCLKAIREKYIFSGDSLNLDSELCSAIYKKVRAYALMDSKPEDKDFFGEIFNEGIVDYYRKAVMEQHRSDLDIDIISALEREAWFEQGLDSQNRIDQYIEDVIDQTRALSLPFIEKPLGEERDPIFACTFNDRLDPEDGSPKSILVEKLLKNYGGEPDESIGKNMILFYQSFYGLRANDLSKFAPPQHSPTNDREGGEYYKAYFELIEKIHPDSTKSTTITPHIDRWWHVVTKMPDLDDANQTMQENRVYAALFWGLIGSYVDDLGEEGKCSYNLNPEKFGWLDETGPLIVSNGTPCDHLYEVLDALALYPELVTNILKGVQNNINRDLNGKTGNLEDEGFLCECLSTFRIREYPLGDSHRVRSIFDIPLLIQRSVTPEMYMYSTERALRILRSELDEIKNYCWKVCSEKERPSILKKVICGQFDLFLKDVEEEKDQMKDVYHSKLFIRICGMIVAELESLDMVAEARAINKQIKELTK